jgi:Xaa-Pro aminopeptidase
VLNYPSKGIFNIHTLKLVCSSSSYSHAFALFIFQLLPGVRQDEFRDRRFRLMDDIHKHASKHDNSLKQHLVVIPSATKVYMTEKIPYVFRQNTDFLYLSGCLEPDSALVLTGMQGDDHVSSLFEQRRIFLACG